MGCNVAFTATVKFDSQGGSIVAPQTVAIGSTLIEPKTPTKKGETFGGWSKDILGLTRWDFEEDTVFVNTTLYAMWGTYYTVTFNSNGGTKVDKQSVIRRALKNFSFSVPTIDLMRCMQRKMYYLLSFSLQTR